MFNQKNIQIILSVVVAGILIYSSYYWGVRVRNAKVNSQVAGTITEEQGRPLEEVAPELIPSPLPTGAVDLDTRDDPRLGQENAPVEVVEFTDFQCPYCKEFFERITTQMKDEYIDTGKVKLYVKDFPLAGHVNAKPASDAINCVYKVSDASKYYQYHDILFARQSDWEASEDPRSKFVEYAGEIKINTQQFEDCYANRDGRNLMEQDVEEGKKYGVNGTPIFFVNGNVYVGVPPTYEDMKKIIEEQLGK